MRAEAALKAFPLFAGTADELQNPQARLPATVRAYQSRYAQQDAAEEQDEADEADAQTEIASLEQRLHQLEDRGEVPTQTDLQNDRARRELGWTAIKHRWLAGEADPAAEAAFLSGARSGQQLDVAYEDAVHEADNTADRLREEAASVEKKVLFLDQIARVIEKLQRARDAKEAARSCPASSRYRVYCTLSPISMKPRSRAEMLDWLETRRDVVDALQQATALRRDLTETEGQIKNWRDALEAALLALDEPAEGSPPELTQTARKVVRAATEARAKRHDLEKDQGRFESERAKAKKHLSEHHAAGSDRLFVP